MELSNDLQSKLEQLAKLPRGVRLAVIFAIGIGLGCGYYFGIYQDKREQLAQLHAKQLELQRKLGEVRSVAANISAFEQEITELEAKLGRALRQLPNKKELEVLLTDISNLGKTAGVEIKSFRRQDEKVHDFYAEVPIGIELEGGYHEIAKFFDLVAKLPRIVNMGELSVKVASENQNGTRLRVSGTATTFRFVGSSA